MHSSSNRIIGSECWMFCPYIFLDGDTISQMRHRGTHFRPAVENLRKVSSRSLLERSLPASPDNLGLAQKCSRQQKIHRAAEPAYACVGTLGGVKPFYEMPAVPRGERVEHPARRGILLQRHAQVSGNRRFSRRPIQLKFHA